MPDVGDIATATLTVSPFSGSTSAALLVTAPDNTTSNPSTSTSDGGATWTASVTYTQTGWWRFKWTVTGTGAGIEYQEVYVSAAPSTSESERLIVPFERFKRWIRIEGDNRDDEILDVLVAATEWVEWKIGGPIAVTTITESVHTNGWSIIPAQRPLVSVTSITPEESSTAMPATAYKVDTTNHLIRFYRGASPGWYTLVYGAGLTTVKRMHRYAGQELARHLWKVQNGTAARGGDSDDIPTPLGFAVPRRVDEMLTPNDLPGIA